MKITTIVGARPQFIKASAVSVAISALNECGTPDGSKIEEILIHTGQHYDYEMSEVFFKTLRLGAPKYNLGAGSGSHGKQLAKMISGIESVLETEQPDLVLVYGDTNSTLAGAIVGDRLHLPVGHVEAGLRSFNRRMSEESNRVLTDHLSSLLFVPTENALENLRREGITSGVYLVGDVMEELAHQYAAIAERESTILDDLKIGRKSYSLATVHRAENADDPSRLSGIVEGLLMISRSETVVWPMHPRTRNHFSEANLRRFAVYGIKVIEPVSYLDMLMLEKAANVILTDSGGVQKEAMWFRVPCVTLRDETEWIETVTSGWNQIAGALQQNIVGAFEKASRKASANIPEYIVPQSASKLIVERLQLFIAQRAGKQVVAV